MPCSPLDRRPQLVPCLCSPVECGAVLPTSLLCQGGECSTAVSHPPYFGTLECDKVADVQRNHATSRDMGVGRGTVGTRSNEDRIAAAATQVLGYFLLVTWRRNLRLTPGGWGRQFTCRQMAVIAVFAAQRGLEGALIDFWTRRASPFAGPTPFPQRSPGDLYPTFEAQYAISQRQTCDNIYRSDISILCDNNIAATNVAICDIVALSLVASLTAAISQQHNNVAFVPQAATCDIANYAKADRIMKREGLCL